MLEVLKMNKREAVAYAQITLDYMQSSKYTGILTPDTFGVEMRNMDEEQIQNELYYQVTGRRKF